MNKKYIIKDWANNICFHGKTFIDFEDAWEFIYINDPCPTEEEENWFSDYYVEEIDHE